MRLAYELGFASATLFSQRQYLRFLSLDGIAFERPVPIGSILRLRSQVTHSSSKEYPAVVVSSFCFLQRTILYSFGMNTFLRSKARIRGSERRGPAHRRRAEDERLQVHVVRRRRGAACPFGRPRDLRR